jgi:hypothetical protein
LRKLTIQFAAGSRATQSYAYIAFKKSASQRGPPSKAWSVKMLEIIRRSSIMFWCIISYDLKLLIPLIQNSAAAAL